VGDVEFAFGGYLPEEVRDVVACGFGWARVVVKAAV
jgi:hypothetical protein